MADTDGYILGRSVSESVRLHAQHLLWKLRNGYELNPQIPITDATKIAELGTRTAIWMNDLAQQLPATDQLHGFDISDSQDPPKDRLPPNVAIWLLDSTEDPPSPLIGRDDVVHLRMWESNLPNGDTGPVIRHAKKLLKPRGCIQWEDADLMHQLAEGLPVIEFEVKNEKTRADNEGAIYSSWVSDLPNRLKNEGFHFLEIRNGNFAPYLTQLCTNTYLLGLQELFQGIKSRCSQDH
ncbi:hypothetical protein BDV23DRAFT_172905 [Aspergillus alliaceus]|uniref:Methyltransferase domain-containing protein n=1 Tax=Petromyces alliaceus TaxID=209559 RepID=A0A5N7C6H8_PETAA|nr:hypothetical protein BDV23DRAFT_172905 [Aspergillus alliaceus]